MESSEFVFFRKKLKKTQKQIAQLLGISEKAVHSYEQGWRTVPAHVERQILFLVTRCAGNREKQKSCWEINKCPDDRKEKCPAWEFQVGDLCWFINGTICGGADRKTWNEKIKVCRSCDALASRLEL